MKSYQKITLITAIIGLGLSVIGLFLYFYINHLIGIPILGLVIGGALLIMFLIVAVNIAALISAFKIKNPKTSGILLIGCGIALFLVLHIFAIPGLVLFVISGILALRERNSTLKKIN